MSVRVIWTIRDILTDSDPPPPVCTGMPPKTVPVSVVEIPAADVADSYLQRGQFQSNTKAKKTYADEAA